MQRLIFLSGFLILALLAAGNAEATETRPLGMHGQWSAYTFMEDGNKVCYMASQPVKAEGNYTRRGDIFALITHRPAEGTENVFSYITGYTYKPGSDVTITIGSKKFTLFTQDDTAWTPDPETDKELVEAIRAGSRMVIRGTSNRGTLTTDTFSLKGSAATHNLISQKCGIK
jgi:hypothetical protein